MRRLALVGLVCGLHAVGGAAPSTPVALEIEDFLSLPITGRLDGTGQTDGMLARVNAFREELQHDRVREIQQAAKAMRAFADEVKEKADLSYEKYVGKALDYLLFTIKPQDLEDSIRDIQNSVVGKGLKVNAIRKAPSPMMKAPI